MANHYRTSIEVCQTNSLKVMVGDHQAHYLKAGNGPPVVLLHGGASDSRDWLGTMAALSHSHSLYAPDLIGFGQGSLDNRGYYLSDFVEFVLGFIQAMHLDSLVLVGHSLGGRVCLEIALHRPEMVRRLVLVDTVGFSRLAWWGLFLGAAAWFVRGVLRRTQPYPKFLKRKSEDKDWLCLDELPTLNIPTLIVWNRRDPYYSVNGAIKAKGLMPRARLEVFQGFGHAPHLQKSELFNNLLLNFLDNDGC